MILYTDCKSSSLRNLLAQNIIISYSCVSEKLAETAYEMEQAGKVGDTARLEELLPVLRLNFSELEASLNSAGY